MIRNDESLVQVLNKEKGILASVAETEREGCRIDRHVKIMGLKKINPFKWFDGVI